MLEILRNLLSGPEKHKLDRLQQRFDDPEQFAQIVSHVLPEAINHCSKQSKQLNSELLPLIEEAVKVSVKRDIHVFADALFPVMGPAIRKSMTEALRQMVQSINQALEHSFSWKGIQWRFEAWRSGQSFAEIVLLHSLVYRVEQVFLIHKKTGILLQHAALTAVQHQDADLVSAMLTAIQDFVNDSFHTDGSFHAEGSSNVKAEQSLNQINMGEFSIWIEQGPDAVIAGAIRGNAPESLRQVFITTLENIHHQQAEALQNFTGDNTPFVPLEEQLKACLRSQYQAKKKKISWMTWGFMGGLLVAAIALLFFNFQVAQHWQNYVQLIKSEPGLVITDASKEGDSYVIRGLRDPLARQTEEILSSHPFTTEQVKHYFQPYQSLSDEFILQRAIKRLQAPEGIEIQVKQGELIVSGRVRSSWITELKAQSHTIAGVNKLNIKQLTPVIDLSKLKLPDTVRLTVEGEKVLASGRAPYEWVTTARAKIEKISGVKHYDDSQLHIDIDLSSLQAPEGVVMQLNKGLLTITGQAPNHWIKNLQEKALAISGIDKLNFDALVNSDLQSLKRIKQELEAEAIFFAPAQSSLPSNDQNSFKVFAKIRALSHYANLLSRQLRIIIQGYSDSDGIYNQRLRISLLRAERIHQFLISNGINSDLLEIRSMVTKTQPLKDTKIQEKAFNRRVSFAVQLINDSSDNTLNHAQKGREVIR